MVFRTANFLKRVRKQTHAAAAALFRHGFGERDAVMAFCRACVAIENFFGNLRGDFFALQKIRVEFGFLCGTLRLNLRTHGGERIFRIFQRGFGGFDFAFRFFHRHHLFELAIFRCVGLRFGVGNFVLQRFVGFVGFHGRALIAIFFCAIPPLIYIELELFSLGLRVRMFFFRGGESRARAAEHRVGVFDALGKRIELRAQSGDTLIEALKLQKLWNCGVHEGRSLAHGEERLFSPAKKQSETIVSSSRFRNLSAPKRCVPGE